MLERPRFTALLLTALLPTLASCGSKESVLLSARVEAPVLTVMATALTTEVAGGFDIELGLGDRAADPTTVKLGTFSLKRADAVLLNPLELESEPEFPITLGIGKSKHVEVTVVNSEGEPALAAELCAGELQIVGTLTDSQGDDRPITLTSARFLPDCP